MESTKAMMAMKGTIKINNSLWVLGFQFFNTYTREFDTHLRRRRRDGARTPPFRSDRRAVARRRRDMKNQRPPVGFIGPLDPGAVMTKNENHDREMMIAE